MKLDPPRILFRKGGWGDLRWEEKMCEANAYLVKEGKEVLFLEDISILRPEKDELYLQNIFGEQKRIRARIKEMNLIDHRILLEEG